MSVSVYVMPVSRWLAGHFRVSWGPDGDGGEPRGPTRTPDEVQRAMDSLEATLALVLPVLPEWDESGPNRLATVFSIDGFFGPFLEARRRAYRQKMPLLAALEPPQLWLPQEFDPAIPLQAPWKESGEWVAVSAPRVHAELVRLLVAMEEDERPDLEETRRVTEKLIAIAKLGVEHDTPVIVEV